jgi:chromosome segregation ATPase
VNPSLAIVFAVLSGLATMYAIYDLWRKRKTSNSIEVISSAVALLKPYKDEVSQLRKDLTDANLTIAGLSNRLSEAELRASNLNTELENARVELAYMRMQVHTLTVQLSESAKDKGQPPGA